MRYLKLIRVPNLFTAMADPWAGYFICLPPGSRPEWSSLILLVLTSAFLYAAGITFNDIHDLEWDRQHHPNRPLPAGQIPLRAAWGLVLALGATALLLAFRVSHSCFYVAFGLGVCIVVYVQVSKTLPLLAGALMGACRGLNLLLGAATLSGQFQQALVPAGFYLAYIFAITLISSREEHGATRQFLWTLFSLIVLLFIGLSASFVQRGGWPGLLPLLALALLLARKVHLACRELSAPVIGQIIRAGVLGVVLFDAALVLGFGHTVYGLLCLLFVVPPTFLSRWFAMT